MRSWSHIQTTEGVFDLLTGVHAVGPVSHPVPGRHGARFPEPRRFRELLRGAWLREKSFSTFVREEGTGEAEPTPRGTSAGS